MNRLQGHIEDIEVSGNLSIVTTRINPSIQLKAIVIETPETAPYLIQKGPINILFKETEVLISTHKNPSISLQNKIEGSILSIERGVLLSSILITTSIGEITSIISTEALDNLGLKEGNTVYALVSLNEIMLSE